jgi:multiple sugar transport system permease protein
MMGPYLLGLIGLIGLPAVLTAWVSFTHYDALTAPDPAGLDNFVWMLTEDRTFLNGLQASLIVIVIAVPLRVAGAFGLALLVRAPGRLTGFLRGAGYLPTLIPDVAYAFVWLYLLNPLYGPLKDLSQMFASGVENEAILPGSVPGIWLTDPRAAQAAVIFMLLFTIGEGMVLLLAALHEIPQEIYEAAALDGVTPGQQIQHITLPLMMPSLLLLTLRDIVFTFQASFVAAKIVTEGGPLRATTYLPFWIYKNATDFGDYGYAAAMTLVMYLVTGVMIGGLFWVARRWREVQYVG